MLVAPINRLEPEVERTIEFKGLNRKDYVEEGEMSAMTNLTSDRYPVLTPRKPRGSMNVPSGVTPIHIISRYERIAMIGKDSSNNYNLYYTIGDTPFTKISTDSEGNTVGPFSASTKMVAINTKICFFPEKTYLELVRTGSVVNVGKYGSLEHSLSSTATGTTTTQTTTLSESATTKKWGETYTHEYTIPTSYWPCEISEISMTYQYKKTGETAKSYTRKLNRYRTSASAEITKFDFSYDLDPATRKITITIEGVGDPAADKQYTMGITSISYNLKYGGVVVYRNNEDSRLFVSSTMGFNKDDAINITGTYTDEAGKTQNTEVSCIIEDIDSTNSVLILPRESFIEYGMTAFIGNASISRTMPDLEHVIEWNNRLWGCNSVDNTIYACKLGDPKNWQYYQGTAMDSYYAQQGTDEDFTGSAVYSQHIIFFKQNSLARVYGTAPSNYQIQNMECFGLEKGSDKSAVTINDMVFYKSKIGLMAYEGSEPYLISEKLNTKYRNVVAGTDGRKYIACCEIADSNPTEYEVVVLDIDNAFWHREDDTRFKDTCYYDGRMYFIDGNDNIKIINPDTPTETGMEWSATFGPFTEYSENRKIYSKLAIRFKAKAGASVAVKIRIDNGEWETVETYGTVMDEGNFIPIIPRRCDHYSVQLSGTGDVVIESLTRRYRVGTGGKL